MAVLVTYELAVFAGTASACKAQEARYASEALGLTPGPSWRSGGGSSMASSRRAARGASAGTDDAATTRHPIQTPSFDPVWRDVEWLREHFPECVDQSIVSRLAMGGRVYHRVVNRWAVAHGFESDVHRGTADWTRLRAAGWIG